MLTIVCIVQFIIGFTFLFVKIPALSWKTTTHSKQTHPVTSFRPKYWHLATQQRSSCLSAVSAPVESVLPNSKGGEFDAQKNAVVLQKLLHPVNGNLTEAAMQCVNFCDESFSSFLNEHIAECPTEAQKASLGRIRYEVNMARQRRLVQADKVLRDILDSGELKRMEARLQYYLRKHECDMPFMVILQLNIEDATRAGAETAVQIMTHLKTLVTEHQDAVVTPPVRLMRMLVRTEDQNIRKQMLRQKLIITEEQELAAKYSGSMVEAKETLAPQCENIIVSAVKQWGGADVRVDQLDATIDDVLEQVRSLPDGSDSIVERCDLIRKEIQDVIDEPRIRKEQEQCATNNLTPPTV